MNAAPVTSLDSLPVELVLAMSADVDDPTLVRDVIAAIADVDALGLIEKPTIDAMADGTDNRVVSAWVRTFGCTSEDAFNEVACRLVRCWGGTAGRVCA